MPFLSKVGYCVKKAFPAGVGFKSRVGFTPFSGDLCNVYVFTNANTDRLDFAAPFTGNLKILIGGTSTTGINPALPTTGWVNSPDLNPDTLIYNEIESNVTALDYIVDETFNGIVYAYAKDDVWYYVNMGEPDLRWVWKLNGTSYGVMPSISVDSNSFITVVGTIDTVTAYMPLFDSPSTSNRVVARVNPTGNGWEFVGLTDAEVNGTPVSTGSPLPATGEVFTLTCKPTMVSPITRLGVNFAGSGFWSGDVRGFAVSGVTNTATYPSGSLNFELLEPYSDDHQFVDSDNGVIANKFNDLPADYREVPL